MAGRLKPFGKITSQQYQDSALEVDIQEGVCQLLDLFHVPYSVTDASRTWNDKGEIRGGKVRPSWPDVTAVIPWQGVYFGKALLIETKVVGGKFQPGQPEMHRLLEKAGALVLVPRTITEVEEVLKELKKQPKLILTRQKDRSS